MPADQKNNYVNKLFYGDNLDVMNNKIPDNSIDLIYLDPPFNSNRNYNMIYTTNTGQPVPEGAIAFCDAWELTEDKLDEIKEFANELETEDNNKEFADFWNAWVKALKYQNPKILAYLVFMARRLRVMRYKLKDTGSLFLHCDPTASHYIKVILDGIFGHKNFRNEIVWHYKTGGASKRHFSRKHDIILWYSKDNSYNFYPMKEKSYTKSKYRKAGIINYGKGNAEFFEDEKGVYNLINMHDVWEISYINSQAKERLGYPTQKPSELLERIIKATTKKGDIVMDPFCGCGTTLDAAQKLNRKWIGIDICMLSVSLIEKRLKDNYPLVIMKGRDYTIDGIPVTMEQIKELIHKEDTSKNEGRYQFQYWAIERVKGFASTKKSGDGGIDGSIYFYKDEKKTLGRMILSVKSNKSVTVSMIRDLIGTMENNKADMAGFICYADPTQDMLNEARKAGYFKLQYNMFNTEYKKVQILTVEEILNGKDFELPFTRLLKKS
ncbi:DNA methyltransferase [Brachyspira hyodysenteriae]|uniref:DNA methyltransferase n=1 Tax=Brachyspira hyodysenteriae TaxID=159 RepID=UPI002B259E4B|nr:DNA methyltransferase [Brachyspira hyodysenteriae]WPC23061.1 DNA methyltransferase [Brachyspira hyodysenteriae]WPC23172.1 DNA methyltransferase [Brachyspira hyodysenteriae]WPC23872.1 DNA methyltransferase [Brachyspira hyodysenteriae]WPC24400.1 DNA methyltransferase [Brachyspira hyodysenteriae]WPC25158.1 DNA methyltransferase [Brachyspira hyodysenteriae]